MKKEDILEKSRQSSQDEGMQNAENQGRMIGSFTFSALFLILAVLCLFFWEINTLHAISALFWTHFSAEWFFKYRFTKKKVHFVGFVCGGLAGMAFTANFIMASFRG